MTKGLNNSGIFMSPYWDQFKQLPYYWHIISFIVFLSLVVFGLIFNLTILVYYKK
jgi:hypothetical protein